jgi:uncharacterized membrane protein
MLGLSTLGLVHTLISLVALAAGAIALVRDGRISPANGTGQVYILFTVATCVTALGIFRHGTIGPPHILAMLTFVVLLATWAARSSNLFGRASRYVETLGLSATLLFHLIPAVTETSTRLPPGRPLVADADAPALKIVYLALLAAYVALAVVQSLQLREERYAVAARR